MLPDARTPRPPQTYLNSMQRLRSQCNTWTHKSLRDVWRVLAASMRSLLNTEARNLYGQILGRKQPKLADTRL